MKSGGGHRRLPSRGGSRVSAALFIGLVLALLLIGYGKNHSDGQDSVPQSGAITSTANPAGTSAATGTFTISDLPREAQETLALIDSGGPYPFRQDDSVFGNRERLLPVRPSGYYGEFTVRTPGSPDRGARRLIRGREGETYYTGDHYGSFHRVERN